MAYKDLHDEPFDETTIAKLEIFEDYAQAWIPTFVMQSAPAICVFDFFAGTGFDKNGVPGSPIRILEKINEQLGLIFQKKVKFRVYLNEFQPNRRTQPKFDLLKSACETFMEQNPRLKHVIEIIYSNEDFEMIFPKLLTEIRKYPSLVYLDQNGIKFLSDKYLLELEKTSQTDFLYFVSASYFWRFGDSEEFRAHLEIDMEEAKKNPYKFIHRNIIDQLRRRLPPKSGLKLYPFSLKKGSNIHGIIFGAKHPRAVQKFLAIAWKRNETNGEANFDIDNDGQKDQLDMFEGRKLSKIERFKQELEDKMLKGELLDNLAVFNFVLNEGYIPAHAADCLKEMKKRGLISYEGNSPLLTYESVIKEGKRIKYILS